MKVIISVPGKWHGFYLARYLAERDCLLKLITSYPKFEVKRYAVPAEKTDSLIIKEILERAYQSLPNFIKGVFDPHFFLNDLYDKSAAKRIKKCDIFVGFSGSSLRSLKKAKGLGAVAVLERASSHIVHQYNILKEEHKKWDLRFKTTHPDIVEQELKEYAEADYIAVPSSFAKRTFLQFGISERKLIQVPYGVDLAEFRQIPKEDRIFRVVYVGAMSLRKGIPYLLQAFHELKLSDAELLLIGPLEEEAKGFFRKYKGSYRWIGPQPQKVLYKYYSQGSVFVMPSIEEGMAYVQAQAMACGLPLVCTTNTGAEDLIEDGKEGFIIPIRDVSALKEKILFLYENQKIARAMAQAAREKAERHLSWDQYGNKIIKAYEDILLTHPVN